MRIKALLCCIFISMSLLVGCTEESKGDSAVICEVCGSEEHSEHPQGTEATDEASEKAPEFCSNCGSSDHITSECTKPAEKCSFCGDTSHIITSCPHLNG